jgi:hypothetical protein
MVAATPTGRKNYSWVKQKKRTKTSKRVDVVMRTLNVSPSQAEGYVEVYSNEEILEMAEDLGETKEFIQQLKSEMK